MDDRTPKDDCMSIWAVSESVIQHLRRKKRKKPWHRFRGVLFIAVNVRYAYCHSAIALYPCQQFTMVVVTNR